MKRKKDKMRQKEKTDRKREQAKIVRKTRRERSEWVNENDMPNLKKNERERERDWLTDGDRVSERERVREWVRGIPNIKTARGWVRVRKKLPYINIFDTSI